MRRRRERAVDDRLQQGGDQPGEQHEDRARHQARRVADDLRHQLRERIRDAVQVQRVEDRHHRHEDDEPEHAERDAGLDAHLLAGALLDAPVDVEHARAGAGCRRARSPPRSSRWR